MSECEWLKGMANSERKEIKIGGGRSSQGFLDMATHKGGDGH